ncbi:MAG: phosphodiester glycosidase family protein [Lactobacillaceae bacterium]|jgi:exopolysaccharide biosynthesis protein|nr:phosphodiester glycosidase family protein [Lactobacillaceae bacterium]
MPKSKHRLKKILKFGPIYALTLLSLTGYTAADTFLVSHSIATVKASKTTSSTAATVATNATSTSTSYKDDNISITIKTETVNNTKVYVADIVVSDSSYLKSALAQSTYGTNITETTSDQAEDVDAIFAINGDYYGYRNDGYVIRNGTLYRSTAGDEDVLGIDSNGNMASYDPSEYTAQELIDKGIVQAYSFGPTLVENGKVVVSDSDEVGQSMSSNPRTAIGQVGENHYIAVVSDGRTSESEGLSLSELAQVMVDNGATYAYNLDGGGSSTMVLNGKVINNPVGGGAGNSTGSERAVSDILYIGYKEQGS